MQTANSFNSPGIHRAVRNTIGLLILILSIFRLSACKNSAQAPSAAQANEKTQQLPAPPERPSASPAPPVIAPMTRADGTIVATVTAANGGIVSAAGAANDPTFAKTSLLVPPGSLGIDSEIGFAPAETFASQSLATSIGVGSLSAAGPAVMLSGDDNAIIAPLSLTLAVESGPSLALFGQELAVLAIYQGAAGNTLEIFPAAELTIANQTVTLQIRRFGVFQVALVDRQPVKQTFATDLAPAKVAGTKQQVPWSAYLIIDVASLPQCDQEREGQLYYVANMKVFQTCSNGVWAIVNLQGPEGPKGNQGLAGVNGAVGPQGAKGDTGLSGPAGPKGDKGDQGNPGQTGNIGPQGAKGDTGLSGPIGPKGDQGDQGDPGQDGSPGPQGDKGDMGLTGPAGPKGDQGDPGRDGQGTPISPYMVSSTLMLRIEGKTVTRSSTEYYASESGELLWTCYTDQWSESILGGNTIFTRRHGDPSCEATLTKNFMCYPGLTLQGNQCLAVCGASRPDLCSSETACSNHDLKWVNGACGLCSDATFAFCTTASECQAEGASWKNDRCVGVCSSFYPSACLTETQCEANGAAYWIDNRCTKFCPASQVETARGCEVRITHCELDEELIDNLCRPIPYVEVAGDLCGDYHNSDLRITAGLHLVTCDVTINRRVLMEPGAILRAVNHVSFFARSNVVAMATEEIPIRFEAAAGKSWNSVDIGGYNRNTEVQIAMNMANLSFSRSQGSYLKYVSFQDIQSLYIHAFAEHLTGRRTGISILEGYVADSLFIENVVCNNLSLRAILLQTQVACSINSSSDWMQNIWIVSPWIRGSNLDIQTQQIRIDSSKIFDSVIKSGRIELGSSSMITSSEILSDINVAGTLALSEVAGRVRCGEGSGVVVGNQIETFDGNPALCKTYARNQFDAVSDGHIGMILGSQASLPSPAIGTSNEISIVTFDDNQEQVAVNWGSETTTLSESTNQYHAYIIGKDTVATDADYVLDWTLPNLLTNIALPIAPSGYHPEFVIQDSGRYRLNLAAINGVAPLAPVSHDIVVMPWAAHTPIADAADSGFITFSVCLKRNSSYELALDEGKLQVTHNNFSYQTLWSDCSGSYGGLEDGFLLGNQKYAINDKPLVDVTSFSGFQVVKSNPSVELLSNGRLRINSWGWDDTVVLRLPTVTKSSRKVLTWFELAGVNASIADQNITVALPPGLNRTNLRANFVHNGAQVKVADTVQVSGLTANDFSSPLTYQVTAADGSTVDYTVSVSESAPLPEITAFSLNGVAGTIQGRQIEVTVTPTSELAAQTASFSVSSGSVSVEGVPQMNGTTVNDFRIPVVYRVTDTQGQSQDYFVRAKKPLLITSFALNGYPGIIEGNQIRVIVPANVDRSMMQVTFATTATRVELKGQSITNDSTARFETTEYLTIFNAANIGVQYVVHVDSDQNPKRFTLFQVTDQAAVIDGNKITAVVPTELDLSAVSVTFAYEGEGVYRMDGSGNETRVTSPLVTSFLQPINYKIRAQDGSSFVYLVTLTKQWNGACGQPNNLCYDAHIPLSYGLEATTPSSKNIIFVDGVWIEKMGNNVLASDGSDAWAMQLNPDGHSYSETAHLDRANVAGRTCPENVFVPGNLVATGKCLYYDYGTQNQSLAEQQSEGALSLSAWNDYTSGNFGNPSWYEGNIQLCASKGMRLPTYYETNTSEWLSGGQPPDANPIYPTGGMGVPSVSSGWTWTATASGNGSAEDFILWSDSSGSVSNGNATDSHAVRCVIP